jgi:cytochrome c
MKKKNCCAGALIISCWVLWTWPSGAADDFNALVFSKTLLFRHASITNGIVAIKKLGEQNHFHVDATEDAGAFVPANLAKYRVIIFLSTSGNILDGQQQAAFKDYVEHGGGLAAVHAAVAGDVATEGSWPWYGEALCASFTNHSSVVQAAIEIEDKHNPSTAGLPAKWVRTDEWYNFIASPRGKARVLMTLDEGTYKGGTMGGDHPIAWCRKLGQGRIWYTALGHTEASFSKPLFLEHLLGGIELAAGVKSAEFSTDLRPGSAPHH